MHFADRGETPMRPARGADGTGRRVDDAPPEGDREGAREGRYWKGRNEEGGGTPRPLSQLFVNPLRAS